MADDDPGKERVIIEHAGGMLRITIPAAARSLTVIVMLLWLCIWPFGEFKAVRDLIGGSENGLLFTIIFLAGWTLAGVFVAYALLWQLTGQEIIELTGMTLKQRKQIPIFSRSREHAVANILRLRPAPLPNMPFWFRQQNMFPLNFKDGTISFDYGRDTHHLASGLDEADAQYAIAEMCNRVKSLCRCEQY